MEEIFTVLIVTKVNVHTLLEMKIRFLDNRRVAINKRGYISESVKDFREDFYKGVMSPAAR